MSFDAMCRLTYYQFRELASKIPELEKEELNNLARVTRAAYHADAKVFRQLFS